MSLPDDTQARERAVGLLRQLQALGIDGALLEDSGPVVMAGDLEARPVRRPGGGHWRVWRSAEDAPRVVSLDELLDAVRAAR